MRVDFRYPYRSENKGLDVDTDIPFPNKRIQNPHLYINQCMFFIKDKVAATARSP
jgi:hypothetical protein